MPTKCYEDDGKTVRACSPKEKELQAVVTRLQKDIPSMIERLQKDIKELKKLKDIIATEKGIKSLLTKDTDVVIATLTNITDKLMNKNNMVNLPINNNAFFEVNKQL